MEYSRSSRTNCAVRLPRSRRNRNPDVSVTVAAATKNGGPAFAGKKVGENKPHMVRNRKIRIRKGSDWFVFEY